MVGYYPEHDLSKQVLNDSWWVFVCAPGHTNVTDSMFPQALWFPTLYWEVPAVSALLGSKYKVFLFFADPEKNFEMQLHQTTNKKVDRHSQLLWGAWSDEANDAVWGFCKKTLGTDSCIHCCIVCTRDAKIYPCIQFPYAASRVQMLLCLSVLHN